MVREIVHLQVGQCGNQIGTSFWDSVCAEHCLDTEGNFQGDVSASASPSGPTSPDSLNTKERLDKASVYFDEVSEGRFVARSAMVDLEPATMDVIKASRWGPLFRPDSFTFGQTGAGNSWAKGHYTEGAELLEEVMDNVRRMTEACECVQGYQITHSLGGGTGSGLGTLILLKIRDDYPDRVNASFSVYPSPRVSNVVVEPYNATLAIHQLLEHTDQTFVIDNEALFDISHNLLKQTNPRYHELNHVISLVMSGITSSLRFPGQLNGDLRKLAVNLVPFPRLHFFTIAQAPLFAEESQAHTNLTVREVTRQMWSESHCMARVRASEGKFLTSALTYRGPMSTQEVDQITDTVQSEKKDDFVEWIPNNIKTTIIKTPPQSTPISGTFIANTTAIKSVFSRITKQFTKLYHRRAFLHWYTQEGMDTIEFEESVKNVQDLVDEYQDKQDAVVDLEEEDDEEDEEEEDEETDLDDFEADED